MRKRWNSEAKTGGAQETMEWMMREKREPSTLRVAVRSERGANAQLDVGLEND